MAIHHKQLVYLTSSCTSLLHLELRLVPLVHKALLPLRIVLTSYKKERTSLFKTVKDPGCTEAVLKVPALSLCIMV